jgi:glycosyltransferase involved in cell wall biosynthesis
LIVSRPPIAPPGGRPAVAFVLKGYPRLSETFIAQEIRALERRGLDIRIVSLREPTDLEVHPVHREIVAPILYLPEYLYQEPVRVLRAWWRARRLPGYGPSRRAFLRDLARDRTVNRIRRFGQALVLAAELAEDVGWLHAHFLHTPASIARYGGLLTGLPWSASAHAKDIWTTPDWELSEKIDETQWVVTCTGVGRARLAALSAQPDKVDLVYHGLDFSRFEAVPPRAVRKEGAAVILSVGRTVSKKGYFVLLDALAAIGTERPWRFIHIGGGPLDDRLRKRAEELGLSARIDWRGPRAQNEVIAAYRQADIFSLAARVTKNGDRDGLPNVLLEAQSQGLAVVTTDVSAIGELVENGRTGLIVPPDDPAALAHALSRLIDDPDLAARLGAAGAARVRRDFAMDAGIDFLARRFGLPAARPERTAAQAARS